MSANKYSADEVAKILQEEGHDITKRTVNYYTFEKKMFEVKETGRNCFTDAELDKIRGIRLLRECTALSLDQIRDVIDSYSLEDIGEMCADRSQSISYYTSEVSSRPQAGSATIQGSSYSSYYRSAPTVLDGNTPGHLQMPTGSLAETPSAKNSRTIKVNDDVTLLVSPNFSTDMLAELIDFIKNQNESKE